MLNIKNLHAEIEGKEILKGVNFAMGKGEIHVIMGPNGGGKSTLAQVIAGNPEYKVTKGVIQVGTLEKGWKDVLPMTPDERFHAGIFLSFQYPVEVAGVNFRQFLRQAVNKKRNLRGQRNLNPLVLKDIINEEARRLGFEVNLDDRQLNAGFSGGEKKKLEVLQMTILQPNYAIFDEPDSGLDIDAIRHIATELKYQMEQREYSLLIITHYQRILDYIKPDVVSIMVDGRIVKIGNASLAKQIEKEGYEQFK